MKDITKPQKKWLESLIPNYIIYYNKKEGGYCPQCKVSLGYNDFTSRKQGAETECPYCRTKAKVSYGKRCYHQVWSVGIIPNFIDKNIVLRYFNIISTYNKDWSIKDIHIKEILRETIFGYYEFSAEDRRLDEDKWRRCKLPYGEYRISNYTHRPLGTHATVYSENVHIYTKKLNEFTHQIPELKYVDYNRLLGNRKLRNRYAAWDAICSGYGNWGLMYEYLQKVGLNNLATQIDSCSYVNLKEKSLKDMLKITKQQYNELVKMKDKATLKHLKWMQTSNKYPKVKTFEDYKIYEKYISETWNTEQFFELFKFSMYKFQKYVKTQNKFEVDDYIHYLNMCKELDMDLKNTFVAFPKDFASANKMITDAFNEMQFDIKLNHYAEKANEYSNDYNKIVEKIGNKFDFETDDYQIVVPQNTREIGIEGYKLRHCVAQYTSQIINGELFILFLRNKKELDVPFFTISIVNGTIDECKGYRNCPRPDDVQEFIDKFAKAKHLLLNKNEHFAAMI